MKALIIGVPPILQCKTYVSELLNLKKRKKIQFAIGISLRQQTIRLFPVNFVQTKI